MSAAISKSSLIRADCTALGCIHQRHYSHHLVIPSHSQSRSDENARRNLFFFKITQTADSYARARYRFARLGMTKGIKVVKNLQNRWSVHLVIPRAVLFITAEGSRAEGTCCRSALDRADGGICPYPSQFQTDTLRYRTDKIWQSSRVFVGPSRPPMITHGTASAENAITYSRLAGDLGYWQDWRAKCEHTGHSALLLRLNLIHGEKGYHTCGNKRVFH
jgi:hypothetical protein